MRHLALFLFLLWGASYSNAQGWTQLPVNGTYNGTWPTVSQYNRIVYEPSLQKIWTRARLNQCGQPFTNSDWLYDIATNTFQRVGWSGGGAFLKGMGCLQPVTLPAPSFSYPGDRHPFHQEAYLNGKVYMVNGVEDRGSCKSWSTGAFIPGTCSYLDLWVWDDSSKTWSQRAAPPFKDSEGVLIADPDTSQLFLFGGLVGGNDSNRLARYDAASDTWALLTPSGTRPMPLDAPGGVYHPLAKLLVLWGGQYGPNANQTYNNQVFFYDPATNSYSQPNPSNPPPGDKFPAMDYDSARNLVLVYDKVDHRVYTLSLDLNAWTDTGIVGGPPLTKSSPLQSVSMDYDPVSDLHYAASVVTNSFWTLKLP